MAEIALSDVVIELSGIWKIYGAKTAMALADARSGMTKGQVLERHNAVVGIADASFAVNRGEVFCIMGLSGSGKSTLLRHINRLIEPSAGEVRVLGSDVMSLKAKELRELRARRLGMVFQHMALLPHRSVRDNVAYPLEIRREPKAVRWKVAEEKLALVGLSGYADRYPRELSGGMQQRVGLARALASDPEILLMDEPFSALDPLIRRELQDQFLDLTRRLKKTALFITHDLDEAIRLGSRIAIMKDGRIIQVGAAVEIVANPVDEYVREFVKSISKLKLISARTIMDAFDATGAHRGIDVSRAPTARLDSDLDHLIGLATGNDVPVLIRDGEDKPVGVVTKDRLLIAIKEGK